MTAQEIASAIRNNVGGGLREVTNFAYSLPQLEDEIMNTRNQILLEDRAQGGVLNTELFMQRIDNIVLDLVRFPVGGYSNSPERVLHAKIPQLTADPSGAALSYFGPPDMSLDFIKYYDSSFKNHRYSRVIKNRPYVYIDLATDVNGKHDSYLFNIEGNNLQEISVRGVFLNPLSIMEEQGMFVDDVEFPAPLAVQEMIIDRLTAKYVEYYRKMNMGYQPNTQTDTK